MRYLQSDKYVFWVGTPPPPEKKGGARFSVDIGN